MATNLTAHVSQLILDSRADNLQHGRNNLVIPVTGLAVQHVLHVAGPATDTLPNRAEVVLPRVERLDNPESRPRPWLDPLVKRVQTRDSLPLIFCDRLPPTLVSRHRDQRVQDAGELGV